MCVLTHYGAQCSIYTLIFKRALISGCLLVRICFWQVERIFPSQAEIYQTRSNEHFLSFHWLSLIQKNRPHNERNSVPRAEICKTSRFGFLEQKFSRAEISVPLKLQVYIYIYTGWWFGTFFPIYWEYIIIPTDELIFFRGVGQPPPPLGIGSTGHHHPLHVTNWD